jgi:hypothetical protein
MSGGPSQYDSIACDLNRALLNEARNRHPQSVFVLVRMGRPIIRAMSGCRRVPQYVSLGLLDRSQTDQLCTVDAPLTCTDA